MKRLQKTIKLPAELKGVGLFSGKQVGIRFLPADPNFGIVFVRKDQQSSIAIPVGVEHAFAKFRRIAVVKDNCEVETVEHILASIFGLGIDNIVIEIDAEEVPVMDGSALEFTLALKQAGIVEQDEEKQVISIKEPVELTEDGATLVALPREDGLSISFTIDYGDNLIGTQHLTLVINDVSFTSEISPSRTFCLKTDADSILAQGLGKGGNYQNTIVVDSNHIIDNELRFKDEFVRHKMLDLLGDLAFLGAGLNAHIIALKSGHATNIKLVKKIIKISKETTQIPRKREEPVVDITGIYNILPHRYPMLLIDRVLELEGYRRAVGIKNVTINEPYFQGHFPGQPVMPGVLQIEAMAQLAGALLLRKEDIAEKVPVLISLDDVRLRRTVAPGDQLRIEAEVIKIRQRTCEVKTTATVDGELVASAYMKFMLIDKA